MTKTGSTQRVAIIQARPVYWDVDATVDLVETKTAEAAATGALLVAFGESFLPGYPAWLDHCPGAAQGPDTDRKPVGTGGKPD